MSESPQPVNIVVPRAEGAVLDTIKLLFICIGLVCCTYIMQIELGHMVVIYIILATVLLGLFYLWCSTYFVEIQLTHEELINFNKVTGQRKSVAVQRIKSYYTRTQRKSFTVILRITTVSGSTIDLNYHPAKLDRYLLPAIEKYKPRSDEV